MLIKARLSNGVFELIFKFVCFFCKKTYHSNLAIIIILDHVWPNGFQDHIDQVGNCPFRLSAVRWRHVRCRNGLLHNCKNGQTGGPFYEKGMNSKTIKIAPNSSLINVLINGQSSLTILIPEKILEMIFQKNFDNFDDFFA